MAPRHHGTTAPLPRLDEEICRFLVRFPGARPDAIVAWTGASPDGIRKALRRLTAHRMVQRVQRQLELTAPDGTVRESTGTVWTVTRRGAGLAGTWRVPGTDAHVSLDAGGVSRALADHAAGVAGLGAWYRRAGFDVGGEREVVSLERPSNLGMGRGVSRQLASMWTVTVAGQPGVHPPDLVAVGRDPQTGEPVRFAIELERACKDQGAYTSVIAAYLAADLPQVWHVRSRRTWDRLSASVRSLGLTWGPSPARGICVTTDGRVRMQGWAPGRVLSDAASWAAGRNVPRTVPAGLDQFTMPVTLDAWRLGTVVDPEVEPLWEPIRMVQAA